MFRKDLLRLHLRAMCLKWWCFAAAVSLPLAIDCKWLALRLPLPYAPAATAVLASVNAPVLFKEASPVTETSLRRSTVFYPLQFAHRSRHRLPQFFPPIDTISWLLVRGSGRVCAAICNSYYPGYIGSISGDIA